MKPRVTQVRAVMARRILVNFRVQPDALRRVLPASFRPKLVNGWGIGGICLIRLEGMRPPFVPAAFGLSSENAAHRIAVEWTDHGITRSGVYIPRRDTNSILNLLAGGRLFPGLHHLAHFHCTDADDHFRIQLRSHDRDTSVSVEARLSSDWPKDSVFRSLEEASTFMKTGSCGWSAGANGCLDAVELRTDHWQMHSLKVTHVHSSFFSDETRFPKGTAEFDSALLMRAIPHTWAALEAAAPGESHHHPRHQAFLQLP